MNALLARPNPALTRMNRGAPPARRPRPNPGPKRERSPRQESAPSPAGLIAITGPPLSGKQALGHYVSEYLPDAVHVSQTDPVVAELRDEDPESLNALLRTLRSELRCGRKVVLSAQLESPLQRERVLDVARQVGAPRLLVEVRGTDPAALERASEMAETLAELRAAIAELKELLPRYRSLTQIEQRRLPSVQVPARQPVEEQVKAVLDGWSGLGAVS